MSGYERVSLTIQISRPNSDPDAPGMMAWRSE